MKMLQNLVTSFLILVAIASTAQQGINYKALIKDGSGTIVVNQNITIQFQILKGAGMNLQYQETHMPNTDTNGIVMVNIGEGTPNSGNYGTIDWGSEDHYLNVKINTGSGLTDMGTTQFMAVPYALSAINAQNAATKIDDLTDGKSDGAGSTVFLGNNAGQNDDGTNNQNIGIGYNALASTTTGFQNTATGSQALYSNIDGYNNTAYGINALYSNTSGFLNTATGAFSLYKNSTGQRNLGNGYYALFANTTGSYNTANGFGALTSNTTANNNTALGYNAGFSNSIGNGSIFIGYEAGYNETNSNRLYIENSNANANNALIYGEFDNNVLRANGTFQIGNPTDTGYAFPVVDGIANQVLQTNGNGSLAWVNGAALGPQKIDDLTDAKSDNDGSQDGSSIYFGVNAGLNDDATDNQNVGIGFEALKANTIGNWNTVLGYHTLYQNTTGSNNVAIGWNALSGKTNSWSNTAVGINALAGSGNGASNTAIGQSALANNTLGGNNTASGYGALGGNTTGDGNTANGMHALTLNSTGSNNTAAGNEVLGDNSTGSNNTAFGAYAGFFNNGNSSVFIGYNAGFNEINSNRLYIENSNANADNALIYGEFDNNILRTNGTLQIGNPTGTGYAFPGVDGTANQVLQTDGNGSLAWVNGGSLGMKIDDLVDAKSDNDGSDDGSSVFLGIDAGLNDDWTNNQNVGIGYQALSAVTSGTANVAIGYKTLIANDTGNFNTAVGGEALNKNIGFYNSAIGSAALFKNTTGGNNTGMGVNVLVSNTTGHHNSAFGVAALGSNSTGEFNTAVGYYSGFNISTGNNNTAIGRNAQVPNGAADNQIRIGNTDIIYAGVQVAWTVTSDKLWKKEVRELPYGLDMVSKLKPVDYIRKNNDKETREMGFLAQDIEQTLKELGYADQGFLTKDDEGRMSLRYNDLIALLTKAVQEQQVIIDDLKDENISIKSNYSKLDRRLKNLESASNQ